MKKLKSALQQIEVEAREGIVRYVKIILTYASRGRGSIRNSIEELEGKIKTREFGKRNKYKEANLRKLNVKIQRLWDELASDVQQVIKYSQGLSTQLFFLERINNTALGKPNQPLSSALKPAQANRPQRK